MIDGMWASMMLTLKRVGFSKRELRRMTLPEATLWMRAIDMEREAEAGGMGNLKKAMERRAR